MFSVYKITNLINNKCYIGSSIRVEKRWQQHKNTAFNENSPQYNYPLYKAFRKYGIKNFTFEVIADNFVSIEEMREYEKEMIIFYNSLNYGYNQTLNTQCALSDPQYHKKGSFCAKVDQQNNILETYISYHEAARKNNCIGSESNIRKVCKGELSSYKGIIFRDLDEYGLVISKKFKPYKNRKQIYAINVENPAYEQVFDSISQAAEKIQVDRGSIQKCIKGDSRYSIVKGFIFRELDYYGDIILNKIDIEERINQYNNENPLINGERHSISEWCSIYGISRTSYYKRIKKGMSVIEAITLPKER